MSQSDTSKDEGKPNDGFPFELNGEKLFAPSEKMRAADIIEIAWEMKLLPFAPGDYRLVSSKNGNVYKPDDYIDLTEDNNFITQPTTSTQVAQEPPNVVIAR